MTFAQSAKSIKDLVFIPHDYQKDAIAWVASKDVSGLFLPPGLGKTSSVLEAFRRLRGEGKVDKMLVVAPIRVCHIVWPDEIKKWINFNNFTCAVMHGPQKDTEIKRDVDIYCVNPDGLKWLLSKMARKEFKVGERWMLVVDESSNFKNSRSQRFKLMKSISNRFTRKVILTGTPAPNGLQNVWSQVYLLDNGARLGKYVTQFFNTYFYPVGYMGYEQRLREGADEEIYGVLNDLILHKSRNELNMPELLKNVIKVELPASARKVYNDMKSNLMAEVDAGLAIASNSAVMAGKLKQIANGALYGEDRVVMTIHEAKIDAVKEIYNSLDGRPLLVFYEYHHDINRLKEVFPNAPVLGGGVTQAEANKAVKMWNAKQLPIMFLHPASAGHGLNLQASGCEDVCFFSITWDQELHEQAIGRVWRQGIEQPVTAHYIVGNKTIDERILNVLDGKEKLQNALLSALEK
jgi:SNF2 family DNA or RNA helicase